MSNIVWFGVNDWISQKLTPVGAIGFVDREYYYIASYFSRYDTNRNGKVKTWEVAASKALMFGWGQNMNMASLISRAQRDAEIINYSDSFRRATAGHMLDYARSMALDASISLYLSSGVKMAGKGLAAGLTSNKIAELAIRKGFEKVATGAIRDALKR